jgi:hypothetical protein
MKMEMIVLIAGLISLIVFAGTVSAMSGGSSTEIPEFSNIGIPIVTIFGLLLFFYYRSRRK